jgi:membrane-associated protease RseP (regulator of RpoE activity)
MRRLQGLLIMAAMMAAPAGAVAGPHRDKGPKSDDAQSETFEWQMSTGRARLGVTVIGLTPELRTHFGATEKQGVLVGHVEEKSAAAAAGLAVGDVLIEVKGVDVDSARDVLRALAKVKKDETVDLTVIRDHKQLTLTAKMLNDPGPVNMNELPSWIRDWFKSVPRPDYS